MPPQIPAVATPNRTGATAAVTMAVVRSVVVSITARAATADAPANSAVASVIRIRASVVAEAPSEHRDERDGSARDEQHGSREPEQPQQPSRAHG